MEDFFRELEECLRGEVSETEYRESIQYYRDYFREQKVMGISEEEIIRSLGSPRLIARSIIDARGMEEEKEPQESSGYYDTQRESYAEEGTRSRSSYPRRNNGLKGIVIFILILLVLSFAIKVLLPIAVILIPVVLIIKLIQGNR